MGATNVVVEGPTDQFLICELIRAFAKPDNICELLDLNSVVMVSAESAPSIEKLLNASQWGDEAVPATVVLVDSDPAGDEIKMRITGKARKCKKLIDEEFVLQVGSAVSNDHPVKTTEDILPLRLFKKSVLNYLHRWWEDLEAETLAKVVGAMEEPGFTSNGVVEGTNAVLSQHVFKTNRVYDKYGVLQEVVLLVQNGQVEKEDLELLMRNLLKLCEEIRRAVSSSQQAARRETGKQAVKRLIDAYFVQNKESSSVFDTQLLLERIQSDLQLLGSDGEILDRTIKRLLEELRKLRSAGHHRLASGQWSSWSGVLAAMQKNPLQFTVEIEEGIVSVPTASSDSPTKEEAVSTDAIVKEEPASA